MVGLEKAITEEDSIEIKETVITIIKDHCKTCKEETTMRRLGDFVSDRDIRMYPFLADYEGASYYECDKCYGSFVYKDGKRLSK